MAKLSLTSIFDLLRRRPAFRRLWGAEVISYIGDWLTYVAVSLLALEQGESLVALALVLVAHSLPHAVAAPLAGVWADRFDRKRVVVLSNVAQALLAAAMAAAAWASSLGALQALLVLRTATGAIFATAQTAAVPRTVHRDELLLANALTSATWSTMFAVGVALGGILAELVQPATVIAIDAGTFIVGALLLLALPAMPPAANTKVPRVIPAMKAAIRHASGDPGLMRALLAKVPLAMAGGGGWVFINQLAGREAGLVSGAMGLGLMHALRATGSGIGPLILSHLGEGRHDDRHVIAGTFLTMFASLAVLATTPSAPVTGLALLTWGAAIGVNWVVTTSAIQLRSPDAMLGRLVAVDHLGSATAQCAGALLGAIAFDVLGTPIVVVAFPLVASVLAANALMAAVHAEPQARPLTAPQVEPGPRPLKRREVQGAQKRSGRRTGGDELRGTVA